MNLFITVLLIGLLSAHEFLRESHGPAFNQGKTMRWLNMSTLIALALFFLLSSGKSS